MKNISLEEAQRVGKELREDHPEFAKWHDDRVSKRELEYKAFAFDVFGELLKNTPVDTSRGKRANWHIETRDRDDTRD